MKRNTRSIQKLIHGGITSFPQREESEAGILLEKEDIQLLIRALSEYIPLPEEEVLHGILLETFEEIRDVDFAEVNYGE